MRRTVSCAAIFAVLLAATWSGSIAAGGEPVRMVSHIRREPLASTALSTAGYSKRLHVLEIQFCNGAIYRYLDVPAAVYRDFISAESKARYYDWNIKGHYQSLRLRTADDQASR